MVRTHWLLVLASIAALCRSDAALADKGGFKAVPTQSQPEPAKDYHTLPFDGNLAELLKAQFQQAKDLEVLKELMNKIRENPEQFKEFKNVKPDAIDPATRERMQELAKKNGLQFNAEQIEALKRAVEKSKGELSKPPAPGEPGKGEGEGEGAADPAKSGDLAASAPKNWLDERVKDLVTKSADTRLGRRLQEQPSFGHFLKDFKANWQGGSSGAADAGAKALGNALKGGAGDGTPLALPHLDWLKLPGSDLDGGSGISGYSGLSGLSGLVSGTGLPGATALDKGLAAGEVLLVLLVGLGVAACAWKLFHWVRPMPRLAAAGLGPWPVAPERVATRRQLIQAFEYLALLLLGERARTANHREIAGGLSETAANEWAADELAALYEKARYDPVEGELPADDLTAARRDLCLLAGMRSASVSASPSPRGER